MRAVRAVARWLVDYRNGLTVAVSVVVVLIGFTVVDASRTRDNALRGVTAQADQARSAQQASTRRIDLLTGEIQNLRTELDQVLAATTDEERQQAVSAAEQRRSSPTTTTTTPATTSIANPPASVPPPPSPAPEPATTTTTAPPPPTTTPPTTAPCTTIPVLGSCITTRASRNTQRDTTVSSTAYCLTGTMASGRRTYLGAIAANAWPLGTILDVSDSPIGAGRFVVEDRIGWGSDLDFALPGDCAAATQWGRRAVTVTPA